ncbi:MAG: hypothetical protein IT366_16460 [Candidatus Hydrogenedentes bacterium]|nr:hypothetical protein [Candidatus Hydrogenedentota bacterium]
MNPKQKRNAIILGVLGLALVYVLYTRIFGETEQDRIYRENMEKSAADKAAGVTPGAAPAAGNAAVAPAASTTVKSQFQKAAVDVNQLIASIQEITFDYDTDRMQVNPMTPLVGPSAHQVLASTTPGSETPGTFAPGGDSQTILRTFRVTGILWDKRDPMAVVAYPMKGQLTSEVVTRGFEFPDLGIKVIDIEQERVILDANGTQVSLQLEER